VPSIAIRASTGAGGLLSSASLGCTWMYNDGMKLFTFFRSSAAFRVRIALNIKGLSYEAVPKAFAKNEHRAADYLALNPQGLLPALETQGSVLSQSLAIIEYLDEMHPAPPLLPLAAVARANVRSMALAIACDIQAIFDRAAVLLRRQPVARRRLPGAADL
jgi:maleylacetoacetate isomerase